MHSFEEEPSVLPHALEKYGVVFSCCCMRHKRLMDTLWKFNICEPVTIFNSQVQIQKVCNAKVSPLSPSHVLQPRGKPQDALCLPLWIVGHCDGFFPACMSVQKRLEVTMEIM